MGIIETLVNPVSTLITDVIDRIFPDKDKEAAQRAELLMKAQELDNQLLQGQLAINQAEAASNDKYTSRWRPTIGYICAAAFGYKFVIQPFAVFILMASGSSFDPKTLPILDWTEMSPVLMGLLGLGIMRTAEKIKGA